MNRIRSLAMATLLITALAAPAQPAAAGPNDTTKDQQAQSGVQAVALQLKVLTETLDLTADQQARITPILQALHDITQKLVDDQSLTQDERLEKIRPWRYKANDHIRSFLNDDQKKKLDEYMQGPHPEMHGSLTGSASSSPQM